MATPVTFPFQGRYFTAGDPRNARQAWLVLHGYGQLAKYFIRKFEPLAANGIYVVAPDALSHFYLDDPTRQKSRPDARTGGSWMTREDRNDDILNNMAFLNAVYRQALAHVPAPLTVLGFSQGGATATRWLFHERVRFERLVLWAGVLPPDIDYAPAHDSMKGRRITMVYGDSDPFVTDSRIREISSITEALGATSEAITFSGGHEIDGETLRKLSEC